MSAATLRELVETGFPGFRRRRMEFYGDEDLPSTDWTFGSYSQCCDQCQRFTEGEVFEEVALRTWLCTDSVVGLYAILHGGKLIAFTYQPARKSDREWFFTSKTGEREMWELFMSYAEPDMEEQCRDLAIDDPLYDLTFDPDSEYDWRTGPLSIDRKYCNRQV